MRSPSRDDKRVRIAPLIERCAGRSADLFASPPFHEALPALRAAETIGRPLGPASVSAEPGAGAAARAQDWRSSSVRAHLAQRDDALVIVAPLLERCNGRFGDLIDAPASNQAMAALRGAETIGRQLGAPAFLASLAALTGRDPRPRKRGDP